MTVEPTSGPLRLPSGKRIEIRDGAGSTLYVRQGAVWITEESSIRDVVLGAGRSFRFTRPGLAIVEAFSDASISFTWVRP